MLLLLLFLLFRRGFHLFRILLSPPSSHGCCVSTNIRCAIVVSPLRGSFSGSRFPPCRGFPLRSTVATPGMVRFRQNHKRERARERRESGETIAQVNRATEQVGRVCFFCPLSQGERKKNLNGAGISNGKNKIKIKNEITCQVGAIQAKIQAKKTEMPSSLVRGNLFSGR